MFPLQVSLNIIGYFLCDIFSYFTHFKVRWVPFLSVSLSSVFLAILSITASYFNYLFTVHTFKVLENRVYFLYPVASSGPDSVQCIEEPQDHLLNEWTNIFITFLTLKFLLEKKT
jgi:hypothetical protein